MSDHKDEGLIASEADFLNTELRMNYGDHLQVRPNDDWRPAIRGLVHGVRHGEEFNREKWAWRKPLFCASPGTSWTASTPLQVTKRWRTS